jgi:hypothetical protein
MTSSPIARSADSTARTALSSASCFTRVSSAAASRALSRSRLDFATAASARVRSSTRSCIVRAASRSAGTSASTAAFASAISLCASCDCLSASSIALTSLNVAKVIFASSAASRFSSSFAVNEELSNSSTRSPFLTGLPSSASARSASSHVSVRGTRSSSALAARRLPVSNTRSTTRPRCTVAVRAGPPPPRTLARLSPQPGAPISRSAAIATTSHARVTRRHLSRRGRRRARRGRRRGSCRRRDGSRADTARRSPARA